MKYGTKTAGVTLLEIMLVLAVAAMVIVMSIRYYQSAQVSQQSNAAVQQVQAIAAGADNLAIGTGSYSAMGTGGSTLWSVIGSANKKTPTNGTVTISANSGSVYSVSMPLSPAVCNTTLVKISANSKIGKSATAPACSAAGVLTYTYTNTN